jgi:hypothetical protein
VGGQPSAAVVSGSRTVGPLGQHRIELDLRGSMAEDGHVRDAQLVPREVAFAPGVELHKGLRDRVREVLLHPQGVPIRSTSRSSKLARKGICEKL